VRLCVIAFAPRTFLAQDFLEGMDGSVMPT
jgi:hypothetical protein